MPEDQPRLFRAAPDAIAVHAHWSWPEGWHLRVMVKRADETYRDCTKADYDGLSAAELIDALDAELGAALGL